MSIQQLLASPSLAFELKEGWELVVISLQDQLVGQSNRERDRGSVALEPHPSAVPLCLSFLLCTMEMMMPAPGRILAMLHM